MCVVHVVLQFFWSDENIFTLARSCVRFFHTARFLHPIEFKCELQVLNPRSDVSEHFIYICFEREGHWRLMMD